MATTPQPNPVEELARDISRVQSDLNSLQSKVRLSSVIDDIEDIDSKLAGLTNLSSGLRKRGYVFEKNLETQAAALFSRWRGMKTNLQIQAQTQAQQLTNSMPAVEAKMSYLSTIARNPAIARSYYNQLKSDVDNLTQRAEAAESSLQGMYDGVESEYNQLKHHIDEVDWMLTQLAQASFTLLPTEAGIMAVKATFITGPKADDDDPQGNLYLTDQRLIFEQKEEVATKKVLFITTERKLVQKLMFEIPVVMVETITPTKQGVFKNEDHLEILFVSGAPYQKIHLHLDGQDCKVWQGLINRAKVKDFDRDRAVAVDQGEVEKVKAAPTICPACGGSISKPVLRGQDTISCEYCGQVIRL